MSTRPVETSETVAGAQLRAFVERIERLQEERKTLGDDIADVIKEAVDTGFDKTALKAILKIRSVEDGVAKWHENSAILDTYLAALGMLPAPAGARARENITQFPIQAPKPRPEIVAAAAVITPVQQPATEKSLAQEPSEAEGSGEAQDRSCESASPPEFVSAFLKRDSQPLRPNCLHPEMCAGVGRDHCWACTKAAGDPENKELEAAE